jgi:hypothetical protein
LLVPTRCQLDLLAQTQTVEAAAAAARSRRIIPVTPSFEPRPEGNILSIPEEAGYPVREFFMGAPLVR